MKQEENNLSQPFRPMFSPTSWELIRVVVITTAMLLGPAGAFVGGIAGSNAGVIGTAIGVLIGGVILGVVGVIVGGGITVIGLGILSFVDAVIEGLSGKRKTDVLKINRPHKLRRPPFSFLITLAHFLPVKYERSLQQEVSDLRIEYFEALEHKNTWRARAIVAQYYAGLVWSVIKWITERVRELTGFLPKMN